MSLDHRQKAVELAASGRQAEAIELFEQALLDDPRDPDILYNLGMCFTDTGHPAKAVKALEKSIEYNPAHSNSYVALGYACLKLADTEKARTYLLQALSIDPDNPYALRNLGGLYGKLGDFENSIAYLEKAYQINPADPNTTYGLAYAYQQSGDNASTDRYYRKALDMDAPIHLKELSRDGLREIAVAHLKSKGLRMDAVMYMVSALKLFEKASDDRVRDISFEIALKGRSGLDINNRDRQCTIHSLPGTFSALQLVSYMYVGFKKIAPDQDVGVDLSQEYETALQLFQNERET